MSASTLITLVLGLLQFANKLMQAVESDKLREDGRTEQLNASLAALARHTVKVRDVEKQVASMSDADVFAELQRYSFDDARKGSGN